MAVQVDPLVTILIPSCEPPAVLRRTLEDLATTLQDLPVVFHVEPDRYRTGIGATLRRGLPRVKTPWVQIAMADGSEDPNSLRLAVKYLQAYPNTCAVWGDRWETGKVVGYPWIKRGLNRFGNHLISRRLDHDYRDWTDLAKLYQTADLRAIQPWSDDFRAEIEIPLRVRRLYASLGQPFYPAVIPRRWVERTAGRSSYRLLPMALKCLWTAWKETR